MAAKKESFTVSIEIRGYKVHENFYFKFSLIGVIFAIFLNLTRS